MSRTLLKAAFLATLCSLLMGACPQRIDADQDGVFSGTDCDDADPFTFPGAPTDFCDGKDNDCDNTIDEDVTAVTVFADQDRDGYGDPNITATACAYPGGPYAANGDDCDDLNGAINPGAGDSGCDGIDNDCDGDIDEDTTSALPVYADQDGDGYGAGAPLGACATGVINADDCDDTDPNVHPGVPADTCDNPSDADCDGQSNEDAVDTDWYQDLDGDGWGGFLAVTTCSSAPVQGLITQGGDCDDNTAAINPAATEVCNFADDDCDGTTDEGFTTVTATPDTDGDGYGAAGATQFAFCVLPSGFSSTMTDCDDANAAVHPGVPTDLCDTFDNDCDGSVDEDQPPQQRWYDSDGDGFGVGAAVMTCSSGPPWALSDGDCDDNSAAVSPVAAEVCNSIDDDCDGTVDNGLSTLWYVDVDNDGYGDPNTLPTLSCLPIPGRVQDNTDCDDQNGGANPGVTTDLCDWADNDCDGSVDEDQPPTTYYTDADYDGYGGNYGGSQFCTLPTSILPYVQNNTDCNDGNSAVNPDASEVCGNGVDDDCNGLVDDGAAQASLWYVDSDGDGYGDPNTLPTSSCTPVAGRVQDNTDCDDTSAGTNPAALADLCDLADNDCDGTIDEDQPSQTRYLDTDGDGYGVTGAGIQTCNLTGPPWVVSDGDCDDGNATIWPGAPELCNGIDDDCDIQVDEGFLVVAATPDTDGDSFGDANATPTNFCALAAGFSTTMTDCDDTNAGIFPGALDLCDGIDNDCDTQIDENAAPFDQYPDADGDGFGYFNVAPISACAAVVGYVANDDDCNDSNASINPTVPVDLCDSIDNDCDWQIDEDATHNIYYPDFDGDGFGGSNPVYSSCYPQNLPTTIEDCNDYDAAISPTATEVCGNGVDDDCDTQIDEGCSGGGGPTNVCGPINTDTTWSGAIEMTCTVDVVGGATLTVAPGTTVSAHNAAELTVGVHGPGSIDVAGTVASPVVFTSVATSPAPGDWGGLFVGAQSGSSSLSNLTVSYGGGLGTCLFLVDLPTTMTVTNVAVDFCGGPSGWIIGNSDVDLLGAVAANNTGEGMLITQDSTVGALSGLVLTGNAGRPGTMPLTVASLLEPGFTLSGNGDDRIEVTGGIIDAQISIPDVGLPYLLMTDVWVENATAGAAVLTLENGVSIEVGQPVGIYTGQAGFGTLDASAGGITLTSGFSPPAPGDWLGVDLGASDEGSVFDGVSISYGGGNGFGNVRVAAGDAAFVSGSSEFSSAYGLYRANGAQPNIQPAWTFANNLSGDLF